MSANSDIRSSRWIVCLGSSARRLAAVLGCIALVTAGLVGDAPAAPASMTHPSGHPAGATTSTADWPPSSALISTVDSSEADVQWVSCVSDSFCMGVSGSASGSGQTYQTWNGSSWSLPTSLPTGLTLGQVSCPTSKFCASAGGSAVEIWNGSKWATSAGAGSAAAISCASPDFCMDVADGYQSPEYQTWNGTSWTTAAAMPGQYEDFVYSVSCPTDTFCAATSSDSDNGLLTWNGMTWTGSSALLNATVSCSAADSCLAYGYYDTGDGDVAGGADWNGSEWQGVGALDPAPDNQQLECLLNAGCLYLSSGQLYDATLSELTLSSTAVQSADDSFDVQGISSYNQFVDSNSLSCGPGASPYCVIASPTGATWAGYGDTGWGQVSVPEPDGLLVDVSCASTTFCVSIDSASYAFTWNGTSWNSGALADPEARLTSLSCYATSGKNYCRAIDALGSVVSLAGDVWSDPVPVFANPVSPSGMALLSCGGSAGCLAVDGEQAAVETDGTWSTPGGSPLLSLAIIPSELACTETTSSGLWCMTVSAPSSETAQYQEYSSTSDWSEPTSAGFDASGSEWGDSLACASESICALLNGTQLETWNGAWSSGVSFQAGWLIAGGVSCASLTFCAVAGWFQVSDTTQEAESTTFDGTQWSAPAGFPTYGNAPTVAVACASSDACIVANSNGTAIETAADSVSANGNLLNGVGRVSGTLATFTDVSPLPASSYSAEVNWGDGTTSKGKVAAAPDAAGYVVSGSHSYSRPGLYSVEVTPVRQDVGLATTTSYAAVPEASCIVSFPETPKPVGSGPTASALAALVAAAVRNFGSDPSQSTSELIADLPQLGKHAGSESYTTAFFATLGAKDLAALAAVDLVTIIGNNHFTRDVAMAKLVTPLDDALGTASAATSSTEIGKMIAALGGDPQNAIATLFAAGTYSDTFLIRAAEAVLGDPDTGNGLHESYPVLITAVGNGDPAVITLDRLACNPADALAVFGSTNGAAYASRLMAPKGSFGDETVAARILTAVNSTGSETAIERLWQGTADLDSPGYKGADDKPTNLQVALLASMADYPQWLEAAPTYPASGSWTPEGAAVDYGETNSSGTVNQAGLHAMLTLDAQVLAHRLSAAAGAKPADGQLSKFPAWVDNFWDPWAQANGTLYGLSVLPILRSNACLVASSENDTDFALLGVGVIVALVGLVIPPAAATAIGIVAAVAGAIASSTNWQGREGIHTDSEALSWLGKLAGETTYDTYAIGLLPAYTAVLHPQPSLAAYLAKFAAADTSNTTSNGIVPPPGSSTARSDWYSEEASIAYQALTGTGDALLRQWSPSLENCD
ncbi:MAG: hypothetical protein ACRD0Z_14025 [Acidimicrobiales bacterium]